MADHESRETTMARLTFEYGQLQDSIAEYRAARLALARSSGVTRAAFVSMKALEREIERLGGSVNAD